MRVLLIAYYFPPFNGPGAYRALSFVRHWREHGIETSVIAGRVHPSEPRDDALLGKVPHDVRVLHAPTPDLFGGAAALRQWLRPEHGARPPAAPDRPETQHAPPPSGASANGSRRGVLGYVSRFLWLPDPRNTWIPPALAQAIRVAAGTGIDAIVSTGPPWSSHVLGNLASRVLGLPLLCDFRDPWVTSPFRSVEYPSLARWDRTLEHSALRRARKIVCNTQALQDEFRRRYPELPAERFGLAPNGYNLEDFEDLDIAPQDHARLRILHAGIVYGKRSPIALFDALRRLHERAPQVVAELELCFMGPASDPRFSIPALAAEYGVQDCVRHLGVGTRRASIEEMLRSHALLLIGLPDSEPDTQVPSKLYDYIGAERWIVALAKSDGEIARILERSGRPHLLAPSDDPEHIVAALLDLHARWKAGAIATPGRPDPRPEFSRRPGALAIAGFLRDLLARA